MPAQQKQTLVAPAVQTLPAASGDYDPSNVTQSNNTLRTFMQRVSSTLQAIFGPAGGQYIDKPNALFFHIDEQLFAAANTAYPLVFDNTYLSNYVRLVDTTKVVVDIGGIYNFQLTAQALSASSSAKTIYLWIRRNGTNIGYSTRAATLSNNSQYLQIDWSFVIDLQVGDYIEMMASVTDTSLHLHSEAASSQHSGIPAAVMTVSYSSPLPATLPTPP